MTPKAPAWIAALAAAAVAGPSLAQPASAPAPAAAPAPAPAPAPAAPAAPAPAPSAVAAYIISTIEKVCLPLIHKQDVKAVAQASGFKRSRDVLVQQLEGVNRITVAPPTVANPGLCTLEVNYDLDTTPGVVAALAAWGAAQTPPLSSFGTGYQASPGVTGWSWTGSAGAVQEGLVFNARRSPDGRPLGKGYDVGQVLFSRTGG